VNSPNFILFWGHTPDTALGVLRPIAGPGTSQKDPGGSGALLGRAACRRQAHAAQAASASANTTKMPSCPRSDSRPTVPLHPHCHIFACSSSPPTHARVKAGMPNLRDCRKASPTICHMYAKQSPPRIGSHIHKTSQLRMVSRVHETSLPRHRRTSLTALGNSKSTGSCLTPRPAPLIQPNNASPSFPRRPPKEPTSALLSAFFSSPSRNSQLFLGQRPCPMLFPSFLAWLVRPTPPAQ
jgi:hypothetical protein